MSKLLSVFLAVVFLSGTVVLADDIQPPPWRGQWSTTVQNWEFLTPNPGDPSHEPGTGVKPDGPGLLIEGPPGEPYIQPGYLPSTELWVTPGPGMQWIQFDEQSHREGIWPLSGAIDVIVDNHNPQNPKKIVWLQITWRPQPGGGVPFVVAGFGDPFYRTTAPALRDPPGVVDLGAGWFESTYTWEIYPNPPDERFRISGTIDVDELVLDTWCVPEPATLGLLLVGGVLALIRKVR